MQKIYNEEEIKKDIDKYYENKCIFWFLKFYLKKLKKYYFNNKNKKLKKKEDLMKNQYFLLNFMRIFNNLIIMKITLKKDFK